MKVTESSPPLTSHSPEFARSRRRASAPRADRPAFDADDEGCLWVAIADELDSDDESGAAQALRFAAKLESFGFSDFDADHLLMP